MNTKIEVTECSDCAYIRALIANYREAAASLRNTEDPFVRQCLTVSRRIMRRAVVMMDLKVASEALDVVLSLKHV